MGGRIPTQVGRVHQTLRVTPAMEAGLATRVWSIEEIVGLLSHFARPLVQMGTWGGRQQAYSGETFLWRIALLLPLAVSLAIAIGLTQVATFSTTIYLHRCATHRALILHPAIAWAFRFALWVTTGLSTREWVAVHRKHHAFTDQEGDPHSPAQKGFWPVQLGNVFYYVRETRNAETIEKYARDIKADGWDRLLFNHGLLGPAAGTVALCTLIGVGWGLLAAGLHGVVYVFFLSSSINGLCHYRGYRTFDNTATNIRWLALLTGGEGFHNNHHGFPRNPKFSVRSGEIDPSWPIIQLLTRMKLARPYRIEETPRQRAGATEQTTSVTHAATL